MKDPANWTAVHYRPAVQHLDQQFADGLELLQRKGALDNAIVVLLSDHGEAVGLPDDSPWSMTGPAEDPYAWPVLTRHGRSVLTPHQYRVVLATRGFLPGQTQTTSAVEAAMRFYEIDRESGRMNVRRDQRGGGLPPRH